MLEGKAGKKKKKEKKNKKQNSTRQLWRSLPST